MKSPIKRAATTINAGLSMFESAFTSADDMVQGWGSHAESYKYIAAAEADYKYRNKLKKLQDKAKGKGFTVEDPKAKAGKGKKSK